MTLENCKKVFLSQPFLDSRESEYVADALDSTWISSSGKYVERFERDFASLIGTKHAASVSNGTCALHLALMALGISSGDEVIVPSFAYVAPANAILYVGATPVFVDSLEDTWNISIEDLKSKISARTRCVIAVHNYGSCTDMVALRQICTEKNIYLVEDAAEALMAVFSNKVLGSFGDMSTFSFFGNKIITAGEGGAICTNNESLHERVVFLRSQAMDKNTRYFHTELGYNFRLTNIACAVLCAQLEKLDAILNRRFELVGIYDKNFHDVSGLKLQPREFGKSDRWSPWLYSVRLNNALSRDQLIQFLASNYVESRPFFYPIHLMPHFSKNANAEGSFDASLRISREGISLPLHPALTEDDVMIVSRAVLRFLESSDTHNL